MLKNKRIVLLAVAAFLLLAPVVFLFVKSSGKPDLPKTADVVTQAPQVDLSALEQTANTNPTFDNLLAYSIACIGANRPGRSIEPLKQAISLNPKSAAAYNNLGCAYTMLMQYQDGIDACTKALQIDTGFQLAKNNLKWASDEKAKTLAVIQAQENTPDAQRDVKFYINYGLNYQKIGQYDKSISIWNMVFDKEPNNADAMNNIGVAYMLKNSTDEAIAMFQKAISTNPENTLAKNNLAWAQDVKAKATLKK
ncbi:MAG: tetratricopeptide repeat protein [Chitinophagales bacterium]|nr:tetratricopeptide repeat protein [Chitinophagales bacterium]